MAPKLRPGVLKNASRTPRSLKQSLGRSSEPLISTGLHLLREELALHGLSLDVVVVVAAEFESLAVRAGPLRMVLRGLRRRRACGQMLTVVDEEEGRLVARQLCEELQACASHATLPATLSPNTISHEVPMHISPPMLEDVGKICFLVADVLTEDECQSLIASCDVSGWHPAALEYGLGSGDLAGESIVQVGLRDSDRCILHDRNLAATVWDRLNTMIPQDAFSPLGPRRVNSCFRCLRYTDGQAGFAKHVDGSSVIDGEISRVTVQLYLNDGFLGGATRLCHVSDAEDALHGVDVLPRRGMAFVFDQRIIHKGCPVQRGVKYTARTEIMYS